MKKHMIALLLTLLMIVSLCACGNRAITAQKAQQIAVKDAGATISQAADIHTHVETDFDGIPYYNIHFSVDGTPYNYQISATGEILSVSNTAAH